jgi:hypothetical protein
MGENLILLTGSNGQTDLRHPKAIASFWFELSATGIYAPGKISPWGITLLWFQLRQKGVALVVDLGVP